MYHLSLAATISISVKFILVSSSHTVSSFLPAFSPEASQAKNRMFYFFSSLSVFNMVYFLPHTKYISVQAQFVRLALAAVSFHDLVLLYFFTR